MHAIQLADWTTIQGQSGVTNVIQDEPYWLDLAGAQDVVMWADIRSVSGTASTLAVTTSPSKSSDLFVTLATTSATASTSTVVVPALLTGAGNKVARWVRWEANASAGGAWSITFRIWLAVNVPRRGRQAPPSMGPHGQGTECAACAAARRVPPGSAPAPGPTTRPLGWPSRAR